MKTKIVNIKKESYDVYIGRGSIWGNPFKIGIDGTREEVIEQCEEWLLGRISAPENPKRPTLAQIKLYLTGKTLGCYCRPLACHGDIYLKFLKE